MGQKYWPPKIKGVGLEGWKSPGKEGRSDGGGDGASLAPSDFSIVSNHCSEEPSSGALGWLLSPPQISPSS